MPMLESSAASALLHEATPALAIALLCTGISLLVLRGAGAIARRTGETRTPSRLLSALLERISAGFVLVLADDLAP